MPVIDRWLAEPIEADEHGNKRGTYDDTRGVLTIDVAMYALAKPKGQVTVADQMRIGRVLAALGYERCRTSVGGERARRWVRP